MQLFKIQRTYEERLTELVARLRTRQLEFALRGAVTESARMADRVSRLRRARGHDVQRMLQVA